MYNRTVMDFCSYLSLFLSISRRNSLSCARDQDIKNSNQMPATRASGCVRFALASFHRKTNEKFEQESAVRTTTLLAELLVRAPMRFVHKNGAHTIVHIFEKSSASSINSGVFCED